MPKNSVPVYYRILVAIGLSVLLCPDTAALAKGEAATAVKNLAKSTVKGFAPQLDMTAAVPSVAEKASSNSETSDESEIYFSADEVENNQDDSQITANGHVEIIRNDMTLYADKVTYNQETDIITADGNVVLLQKDGNVVFSDHVKLTDKMTKGEMQNIKVIMQDKTRMAARTFRRGNKDKKIMTNAVYTPCDVCRDSDPLWQIKATKVEHNAETKDIHYQNAFLELKGVPVLYTPFLSHPDPTVKRRSGFLFPKISSNSYLGAAIQPKYFWNISDQEDILFSPIISSDKGVVASGAYNKYFYRGDLSASGSYLKDPDTKHNRGNLFLTGRYEVNDYWVADTDINYASDSAYLKDLSLPKKDDAWLTSRASLQGFDNRNYAAIDTYYYTLLSYDLRHADKPTVAPLFNYENYSDPNRYGAYSKTTLNMASVTWDDSNSSQRATMINSWNLPYTSPFGEKYKMVASVKSDLYYVDNYQYNNNAQAYDGAVARVFPQLGLEWRLPFVRATEDSRQILEPVIVGVAAPNGDNKIEKIPNQDSQDVALDDTNILDLDRYAGYDRNDDGSRLSYGLNWSAYGEKYGRTSAFLAQSYKFNKSESFTDAEGQEGDFTDYVGRIYAAPNEYFDMNYRFKLDKDNYKLNYSELSSSFGPQILKAYVGYIYFQANDSDTTSLDYGKERKELYTSLSAMLTKDWSVSIYNRQDLTDNGGSLEHGGTLTYEDECSRFQFIVSKDNSSDPNYEGDFEISFAFFLKTLGGTGTK